MKAVYHITTCCSDYVDRVECELPAGCNEPDDYDVEAYALEVSGYKCKKRCDGCGDNRYRAHFAGYPLYLPLHVRVLIDANDREELIDTLETVLAAVRDAPDSVTFVEHDGRGGRMQ